MTRKDVESLFKTHYAQMYHLALTLLFDEAESKDVVADTIPVEPYVFNNVPLDSMLTAIAAAHRVQVEFENEAARHLRFHFVWKREDSLSRVVEKLNTFEAVNIVEEDKTLLVR